MTAIFAEMHTIVKTRFSSANVADMKNKERGNKNAKTVIIYAALYVYDDVASAGQRISRR